VAPLAKTPLFASAPNGDAEVIREKRRRRFSPMNDKSWGIV
jgi:hypothetical protein